MRARWEELLERFAGLTTRERMLILLAVFAVTYQLANFVVLDRQYKQIEQAQAAITTDRSAVVRLINERNLLSAQAPQDLNRRLRAQIEQARSALQEVQSRLTTATGELISPRDMARFLEELLVQERELTLLRLQTLDAEPLLPAAAAGERVAAVEPVLHRHGFAIEFSGGYMATLRYLQALEALPWRFFWDSVDYEVIDYPRSVVRLKLHTLSLSEDWIGV